MTFILNKFKKIEIALLVLCLPFLGLASDANGSLDLSKILTFFKGLNTSQTGEVITYMGFFGGLAMLLFSNQKLWGVIGLVGVPLIINYGPDALISISGAGAVIF